VFSSHLASQLAHDFLFQDVDVAWYRNPLEYFAAGPDHDNGTTIDMFIQDDGSRGIFYGPRSSNAGFYFARNNEVTREFFHSYLLAGDHVVAHRNDQIVFNILLNEHASMYGMRVYTMSRLDDDFPTGSAFYHRSDLVEDLFAGKVKPYVFHVNWTGDKAEKIQLLQQMGGWFVSEACVQKRASEILHLTTNGTERGDSRTGATSIRDCCLPEPVVKCHKPNLPSLVPCNETSP
jgi:hypothetical protein